LTAARARVSQERMKRILISIIALFVLGMMASSVFAADAKSKNPVVVIKTSMGVIKAELYQDKAPISVENFLKYVDDKFYDGTIFHRVIKNFMIQGGGFDKSMTQKSTRPAIKNESSNGLKNTVGTLAMARTPNPDSATAQFFVNVHDNAFLDKEKAQDGVGYAVFGKVTDGLDVVMKIAEAKTGSKNGMGDVPEKEIFIESIRRAGK
jgi:cyclophilin family peptidyl-prolyl cis-trans isomerase